MLVNYGTINERSILYCDLGADFSGIKEFPNRNWALFAIADKDQLGLLHSFAEKCLDLGALYICGAGEACSEIDDAFDFVIVNRKLTHLKRDLEQTDFVDSPMTTWHHDFNEGFWFAAIVAHHDLEVINKVVVANLTNKSYEHDIKNLVAKINAGWLPSI